MFHVACIIALGMLVVVRQKAALHHAEPPAKFVVPFPAPPLSIRTRPPQLNGVVSSVNWVRPLLPWLLDGCLMEEKDDDPGGKAAPRVNESVTEDAERLGSSPRKALRWAVHGIERLHHATEWRLETKCLQQDMVA